MSSLSIKTIKISGFRSFKQTDDIEPFSPRHNAVVGRNGSGKSNFFDAVEFVLLSQRFYSLRQDERQRLLHEGTGANVMSAYVEIVFNNTEGRMPVEGAEVTLRRALGVKKDEFFVNGRRQSRKEVEGLLESAGFSRANPYYIVQQGKVNALCVMKDEERLVLLKKIGGAGVYEEKRKESLQLMKETEAKREKIGGVVSAIEERLEELEGEKAELQAYERLDREHRALTYSLYDQELQKARSQLEDLESSRESDSAEAAKAHEDRAVVEAERLEAEQEQREASAELKKRKQEAEADEKERSARLKEAARARSELAQQKAKLASEWRRAASLRRRLRAVNGKVRETLSKRELNEKRRDDAQTALAGLGEEEETDVPMGEIESAVENQREAVRRGEAEIAAAKKRKAEMVAEAEKRHAEAGRLEKEAAVETKVSSLSEVREATRSAQREQERTEAASGDAQEALRRAESKLRSLMPPPIARGLASLERALKSEGAAAMRAKHHGTLLEHLELTDEKYRTAVEVACGPSLWHVVVDDDEAAAASVRRLEREGGGRLTFIPVNRLRSNNEPEGGTMTEEARADVAPLLEVALELPSAAGPREALKSVLSRKLLARSNEAAAKFSKLLKRDAVTLQGDATSKRGATEGGYRGPQESPLAALAALREAKNRLGKSDTVRQEAREAHVKAQEQLASAEAKAARLATDRDELRRLAREALKDHESIAANVREAEAAARHNDRTLGEHKRELAKLQADLQNRRRSTPLTPPVDTENAKEQRQAARSELALAGSEAARLEASLTDDLAKERDELRRRLGLAALFTYDQIEEEQEEEEEEEEEDEEIEDEEDSSTIVESQVVVEERCRALEVEVKAAEGLLKEDETRLARCETRVRECEQRGAAASEQLEEASTRLTNLDEEIGKAAKIADRAASRKQVLTARREETMRQLRGVGTLPERELADFKKVPSRELMAQLERCNKERAKINHVNKKALDQYVNFSEQRATLLERREELDTAATKIEDLVDNLDAKKEEAIQRTFKGVSKHFSEVFRELVPGGTAQLVMVRRDMLSATNEDDSTQEDSLTLSNSSDSSSNEPSSKRRKKPAEDDQGAFEAVQVLVRFPGSTSVSAMNALSGGQKALVALALIFAIQRCDPAPFYLFDEIDAALDSSHRTAVAALIHRQANSQIAPAQFITTTFRREFVNVADAHYGISIYQKTSHVNKILKAEALRFVTEDDDETPETPAASSSTKRKKKQTPSTSPPASP